MAVPDGHAMDATPFPYGFSNGIAALDAVLPFTVAGDGETRVHGVSFANCTFRPVRSREGQVVDREAGKLSGDNDGAIRIEQADGVSFRACTLRWDGNCGGDAESACRRLLRRRAGGRLV